MGSSSIPAGAAYVALGSSFAAGPGLTPRAAGAPRKSGRSDVNYAHLLAAQLGLKLTDVTFSGATASELLRGTNRAAQLDSVGAGTRLVTITAGGNDVGYLPSLTLSSLPGPLRSIPAFRRRVAEVTAISATDLAFSQLESSLTEVVGEARRLAPSATIAIVDYLRILPETDDSAATDLRPLTRELLAWGRGVATRLSATFASVATSTGASFVPVGELSRDHHAWAAEPWTRRFHPSLRGGAPYHPNAEGMRAVARILAEHLA